MVRLAIVLAFAACDGPSPETPPASGETPEEQEGANERSGAEAAPVALPIDPAALPSVGIEEERGGRVLVVRVDGTEPVQLQSVVVIQNEDGEGHGSLRLRGDCTAEPACVALRPGAELRTNPMGEVAPCGGENLAALEGPLQLVVSTCPPDGHQPRTEQVALERR